MSWVKIYLYDILDLAHVQHRPVQVKSYVDDITQSQVGHMKDVLNSLVPAAMLLAHQLEGVGCAISAKSALVCSHADLGRELAACFRATGLHIQLQAATRDLGVMTTAGKKRSTVK
eukprot:5859799-Pyramimonas_sp.AAC.1